MLIRIIGLLTVLFLVNACDTKVDTCKEQSAWLMKIGFYSVEKTEDALVVRDSVINGFSAVVLNTNDSVTMKSNVIKANFPLSQVKDTSSFKMKVNGQDVILIVKYSRNQVFLNYTCGFRTNFQLDTLYAQPSSAFDSIVIIHSTITDVIQENCKFYFTHPAVAASQQQRM